MANPSSQVFENWEFLRAVHAEFDRLGSHSVAIDNENAHQRAHALAGIVEKTGEWPESWQQLASAVYSDTVLDERIRHKSRGFVADSGSLERIAQYVKQRLVLACIRNASRWYNRPKRGESWRGFLLRHVGRLVARAVEEEGPQHNMEVKEIAGAELRPEQIVLQSETSDLLSKAIMELNDEERLLVELHFVQSLTLAEVARRLDLKYSTASDRINRALDKLRNRLIALGFLSE